MRAPGGELPRTLRSFLRPLFRENWVVYAKPPFGGSHHVLGYSGPLHPSCGHHQPWG